MFGHQYYYWWTLGLSVIFILLEARLNKPSSASYYLRLGIFLIGCSADSLLIFQDVIRFDDSPAHIPLWLVVLWGWFSFTFSDCYAWLEHKVLLAGFLGGCFGPVSYWAASRISPLEILQPITFIIFSSLFWGTLFAVAIYFSGTKQQSCR